MGGVNLSFLTLGRIKSPREQSVVVGVNAPPRPSPRIRPRRIRPQKHLAHLMVHDSKNRRWQCVQCLYHRTEGQISRSNGDAIYSESRSYVVLHSKVVALEPIEM